MSNLQGWAYMEELLSEQFYKEFVMNKKTEHVCDMCKNAADYVVKGYHGFGKVKTVNKLCAKHSDRGRVDFDLRYTKEPIEQFKETN